MSRVAVRRMVICANPACQRPVERPRWHLARVAQPACGEACKAVVASLRPRVLRRGGRILRDGYVYRKVGKTHHHADAQGYAPEHILVAEDVLGRRLRGDEVVKRVSLYRRDNRPDVLFVVSPAGTWSVVALAAMERIEALSSCV